MKKTAAAVLFGATCAALAQVQIDDRLTVGHLGPTRYVSEGCVIGRALLASNLEQNQFVYIAPVNVPLAHLPVTTAGPDEWIHVQPGALDDRDVPNLVFSYGRLTVLKDGGLAILDRVDHPARLDEGQGVVYSLDGRLWWAWTDGGEIRVAPLTE